jgi:hypothetical protein
MKGGLFGSYADEFIFVFVFLFFGLPQWLFTGNVMAGLAKHISSRLKLSFNPFGPQEAQDPRQP